MSDITRTEVKAWWSRQVNAARKSMASQFEGKEYQLITESFDAYGARVEPVILGAWLPLPATLRAIWEMMWDENVMIPQAEFDDDKCHNLAAEFIREILVMMLHRYSLYRRKSAQ